MLLLKRDEETVVGRKRSRDLVLEVTNRKEEAIKDKLCKVMKSRLYN